MTVTHYLTPRNDKVQTIFEFHNVHTEFCFGFKRIIGEISSISQIQSWISK